MPTVIANDDFVAGIGLDLDNLKQGSPKKTSKLSSPTMGLSVKFIYCVDISIPKQFFLLFPTQKKYLLKFGT